MTLNQTSLLLKLKKGSTNDNHSPRVPYLHSCGPIVNLESASFPNPFCCFTWNNVILPHLQICVIPYFEFF